MSEQSILANYPDYECVIGIEVHVQLNTKTKIFCRCKNNPKAEAPNSNICQICTGYPGVLPVVNQAVINNAIMAGLATNCTITPLSKFDRKHYFYPDLPKGFQITQGDNPICTDGFVPIKLEDNSIKNIRLMRIHMEEDAGKNIHAEHSNESFVDLNRAGTPLLEMVTQPDISNAYEARTYLKNLRQIVMYLGISTGNMQEGSFRGDTNISVRKKGGPLGTRVELKNINSFKFISDAIEYEIERQIELIESGEKVKQETRLWDTKAHITKPMRSKEEAADYRYFTEPDLPFVEITEDMLNRVKARMPELPQERFERYLKNFNLSDYEADILLDDQALAAYFEDAYKHTQSKQLINWILRNVMGYLKEHKVTLNDFKLKPEQLAKLVTLLDDGKINNQAGLQVFEEVAASGKDPEVIVKELGLEQIQDTGALEEMVKEIIAGNPKQVEQYKAGNEKLFGFFIGQAMKKSQGKGNPQVFNELFKKHLV